MTRPRLVAAPRIFDAQKARTRRDALDAQFRRNMGALHAQLDRGPRDGETLEQLADRLVAQMEKLLHRLARRQIEMTCQVKRARGRPKDDPQLCELLRSPKRRGRPTKFTPRHDQRLLADVDTFKALRADKGLKAGDSEALRRIIFAFNLKSYRQEDRPLAEARRLAQAAVDGPLFRARKRQLTRLRNST